MTPDDTYQAPVEMDAADSLQDAAPTTDTSDTDLDQQLVVDDPQLIELAQPFVGQWNQLISTTNWEKGRIISQWRQALIESDADASQYSDDAWSRRVGGVTAPHVGRLRRVHDRFADTYASYEGLFWSHFLAALDWDDAPLWLEGASGENWSVAAMRQQRWQAHGAVDSQRPTNSQIVEVEIDEDVVIPDDNSGRTKQYGDEPGTGSGPRYDEPDFGDEDELQSLAGGEGKPNNGSETATDEASAESPERPIQPFVGLAELPDDIADAIEMLKLAVL